MKTPRDRRRTNAVAAIHRIADSEPAAETIPIGVAPTDAELNTVISGSPDNTMAAVKDTWMFRWGIFGFMCLFGIVLIIVTYRLTLPSWESDGQTEVLPTVNSVPTQSPAPSPQALNRSVIRVHVVNATGVAGRARKVLDAMVKLGYTDNGVETSTTIQHGTDMYIPPDLSVYTADIVRDVESKTEIIGAAMHSHDEKNMIVIILGTQ